MRNRIFSVGALLVLGGILVAAPSAGAATTDHDRPVSSLGIGGTVRVRPHGSSHAPPTLQVRVEVSYRGFDGEPDFQIEALEGQLVEITFVWADEAVPDNAHRLLLRGYGLSTELIDSENREATLRFVADRAGIFDLVCDWRCEGHNVALQGARLKVGDVDPNDLASEWLRNPVIGAMAGSILILAAAIAYLRARAKADGRKAGAG